MYILHMWFSWCFEKLYFGKWIQDALFLLESSVWNQELMNKRDDQL